VDLAAFHLLAGVVTHGVVSATPFSADFTDWLLSTAAEGLASRPIRSRSACQRNKPGHDVHCGSDHSIVF
jgi:hypothetical protein